MKIEDKILAIISLVLAIILFVIADARAQFAGDNPRKEIFLRVIHIDSPNSMDSSKAYSIYQETAKYFTINSEIELIPSGFISVDDPLPHLYKLQDYLLFKFRALRLWSKLVDAKLVHKARKREIVLIIDRVLDYNGNLSYIGGHSNVCSLYCLACYSYMHGSANSSIKVAIHEVGHALGAKHEDNTIMGTDIPNFILGSVAQKRIVKCNRKWTKKQVRFCKKRPEKRKCLRRWRLR